MCRSSDCRTPRRCQEDIELRRARQRAGYAAAQAAPVERPLRPLVGSTITTTGLSVRSAHAAASAELEADPGSLLRATLTLGAVIDRQVTNTFIECVNEADPTASINPVTAEPEPQVLIDWVSRVIDLRPRLQPGRHDGVAAERVRAATGMTRHYQDHARLLSATVLNRSPATIAAAAAARQHAMDLIANISPFASMSSLRHWLHPASDPRNLPAARAAHQWVPERWLDTLITVPPLLVAATTRNGTYMPDTVVRIAGTDGDEPELARVGLVNMTAAPSGLGPDGATGLLARLITHYLQAADNPRASAITTAVHLDTTGLADVVAATVDRTGPAAPYPVHRWAGYGILALL